MPLNTYVRESLTPPDEADTVMGVAGRKSSAADVARAAAKALDDLLSKGGDRSHLERARLADELAAAAERLSRAEVMAAREEGVTWEQVGETFGVSRQGAHERFRTGPDGLHSRLFKASQPSRQPSRFHPR